MDMASQHTAAHVDFASEQESSDGSGDSDDTYSDAHSESQGLANTASVHVDVDSEKYA